MVNITTHDVLTLSTTYDVASDNNLSIAPTGSLTVRGFLTIVSDARSTINLEGDVVASLAVAVILGTDARLTIGQDVVIAEGNNNGFLLQSRGGNQGGALVVNHGTVFADSGIASLSNGNNIFINHGSLAGGTAGLVVGQFGPGDKVVNTGTITVLGATIGNGNSGHGVVFDSIDHELRNSGTIEVMAADASVIRIAQPTGSADILNTGQLISHRGVAIECDANAGDIGIRNSGLIDSGGSVGVRTGAGNDVIINTGRIVGAVSTGDGADLIDLRGGTVTDHVAGGAGSDEYRLADSDVILTEGTDAGIDSVFSSVTFALGPNFERLFLTGSASIAGTGNAGVNTVSGNAGDNRLLGLGGDDSLFGGAGDDVLNGGVGQDAMLGGDGDDRLIGNLGNDTLDGADGADRLTGGAGADVLTGGTDDDAFIFLRRSDSSASAATADTITDFTAGRDTLDLSAIDANVTNARPNDAFTWIGTAAFTAAGQVRHVTAQGVTTVQLNLDAAPGADMIIRLTNGAAPLVGDVIL